MVAVSLFPGLNSKGGKMEAKQLQELVLRYQENREFIGNEETAKVALVIPFIKLLGYDPSMPREVRLEYTADFTQGDGKKLPDRMDFAIFDRAGARPMMVIETKPLGTDLQAKSAQLARYIAQMPELHFGIMTDGCDYLFFGDLENPNQMDREPFFSFSLNDPKTDWGKVAEFLAKFSRDAFNAETLITDAENSRYRQAMIDRLVDALRNPADDETFLRWLTAEVYRGKRTTGVMSRLGEVASEAIEPALLRVMGDEFLDKLKQRIHKLNEGRLTEREVNLVAEPPAGLQPRKEATDDKLVSQASGVVTTEEELQLFATVQQICGRAGVTPDDILHRDTTGYFNVSFKRPTRWFVRFFGNGKRKSLTTLVPVQEARELVPGFQVEDAPTGHGLSRIYLDSVPQLWALSSLLLRSLELLQAPRDDSSVVHTPATIQ